MNEDMRRQDHGQVRLRRDETRPTRPMVEHIVATHGNPPDLVAVREWVQRLEANSTRTIVLLDELAELVAMHLSHFVVPPSQNARGRYIETVEYQPLRDWIAAKRAEVKP